MRNNSQRLKIIIVINNEIAQESNESLIEYEYDYSIVSHNENLIEYEYSCSIIRIRGKT